MKRHLAVAFVTIAAVAGCASQSGGGTGEIPPVPRASDQNGVPTDLRADEVSVHEDGSCWWRPEVNCPPPEVATCNPPAPMEVSCPDGVQQPQ